MSARGVAIARNGAIAAVPSSSGPAWTGITRTAGVPTASGGTNGAGGRPITNEIWVSSSGAATDTSTRSRSTWWVSGRTSMPPVTISIGCSR